MRRQLLRLLVIAASAATACLGVAAVPASAATAAATQGPSRTAPVPRPSPSGSGGHGARDSRHLAVPRTAVPAGVPRGLYDPVGADGIPQHELLQVASAMRTADPDYAGVALDSRAGVVNLYLTSSSAAVRTRILRGVPAGLRTLVHVHQVPESQAALQGFLADTSTAVRRLNARRVPVQSWWPDFQHGVIGVVLYKPSATQLRLARAALAGIPVSLTTTTVRIVPTSLATRRAHAAPASFSNCTGVLNRACDTPAWAGGDFIDDQSYACTDSWPVVIGSSYYLLTAGHCDVAGKTWLNGYSTTSVSIGSGTTIGAGASNALQTSANLDAQLLPVATATGVVPSVWTGSYPQNSITQLLGNTSPVVGTVICNDGAFEGTICGAPVSQVNTCVNNQSLDYGGTANFCSLDVASLPTGQVLTGQGDSGGPDYVAGPGGVFAAGLNSLENDDGLACPAFTNRNNVCSSTSYFTTTTAILAHYGATLLPPVIDVSGGGAFEDAWYANGDATGPLQEPAGGYFALTAGEQQDFIGTSCTAANAPHGTGSAIFWSSADGTNEVQGCIYQAYEQSYDGPVGALGYPTTDEQPMGAGRASYFSGASRPSCSTGSEPSDGITTAAIYWNPASGSTHDVTGCIFAEYHALGEATGSLGFPIDDAYSTSGGGTAQDFQNGTISGSNGSYSVTSNGQWVVGHAAHAGDDYPYETVGQFEHQAEGIDAWNEFYGQCDSFAAWKVYENLAGSAAQPPGKPVPAVGWTPSNASVSPVNQSTWFNADNWDVMGRQAGWTVNTIPAPGTIAYWPNATTDPQDGHPTSTHGMGEFGHVGYVTDVYPDGSVTIESYNLRLNGEYSTIHMGFGQSATDTSFSQGAFTVPWPTYFIHAGDGIGSATPASPEPASGTVSWGYPTQVKVVGPGSPSSQYTLATSTWYSNPGHGELGSEEWTHTNGATADSTATYTPSGLAATTCYQVDAFVPDNYSDNPVAVYTVSDAAGTHLATVNDNVYTNDWAELGVYETNGSGGGLSVRLDDRGTTGLYVAADAMRFWRQPSCSGYGDVAPILMPTSKSSGWTGDSGHGFSGAMTYSVTSGSQTVTGNTATWAPSGLLASTCYEVEAYVPDNFSDNNAAIYHVTDSYFGGFYPQVNENSFTSQFASLGGFKSGSNGTLPVTLQANGPPGQYVAADALAYAPDPACDGPAYAGPGTVSGLGNWYLGTQMGPGSAPANFWTANAWFTRLGHGLAYHELWTYDNGSTADSTARWNLYGNASSCYNIQAFIPNNFADNPSAHYTVATDNGQTVVNLNQAALTGWSSLTTHVKTGSDGIITVVLDDTGPATDSSGNPLYTAADAMEFDPTTC